ncbi:MAG: hypothetical protein H6760_02160 [Candidatus Nomurabacteria bacterium]|nr:MAG: hypothetical protein H6760_02160 [Candidatus Nomurabacteria bacterium]
MDHSPEPKFNILARDIFAALLCFTFILLLIDPFVSHFPQNFISYPYLVGTVILIGVLTIAQDAHIFEQSEENSVTLLRIVFPLLGSVVTLILTGLLLKDFGLGGWIVAALTGILAWSILSADIRSISHDD